MDIESNIQFIVTQQAQFSADIGFLKDEVRTLTGTVQSLAGTVQGLASTVQGLSGSVQGLTEDVRIISGATRVLIEATQENRDAINALRENAGQTTNDLHALIKIVDDLVRRDNGKSH